MDNVSDMTNCEFLGKFEHTDATVYRYRRTDITPEEESEIILGVKKLCVEVEMRLRKEAEEKKAIAQQEGKL